MENISKAQFEAICKNTTILRFYRGNLPKISIQHDDTFIKFFYPKKKLISSDKLKPRALCFRDNAKALISRGFNAPKILNLQFCPDYRAHILYYKKLAGDVVRNVPASSRNAVLTKVVQLVAELHKAGIFFGAIHLENILYLPSGELALVDIVELKAKKRPLSIHTRFRNLKHLFLHDKTDYQLWKNFGIDNFLAIYFQHIPLATWKQKILSALIKRKFASGKK